MARHGWVVVAGGVVVVGLGLGAAAVVTTATAFHHSSFRILSADEINTPDGDPEQAVTFCALAVHSDPMAALVARYPVGAHLSRQDDIAFYRIMEVNAPLAIRATMTVLREAMQRPAAISPPMFSLAAQRFAAFTHARCGGPR